jgi:heme/copper-type cytochrome/quinol oxidase subunit 3
MLTNIKNKAFLFLVLTLVFAVLFCVMGVTAFAHDENTTTQESKSAFEKWWDSYNQIIGYCVAGVIFVAMVIVVYLWVPKNNDKKKTTRKKA